MQVATAARIVTPGVGTPRMRPVLHDISRPALSCANCNLRRICMPVDVLEDAAPLLETLVGTRLRLHKGDVLFRAGDGFAALYAIRSGSCKTVMLTDDGGEQVAGYHLAGEIIGAEGIGADVHACEAVALEDCEVCAMPFDRVQRLAHEDAGFQRRLYRLLSDAILRERSMALMLGTMRAEQRLASFLLDLALRYQARGYSSTEFVLRMTREEIGSHLGLKLETVSRLFSRFDEEGLILARGRVIKLLDRIGLQQLLALS